MKVSRFAGVGVALLAVLAFSAMAVAGSASATVTFLLALWLSSGTAISSTTLASTVGELLLENLNAPIVKTAVSVQKCSGLLIGFVGLGLS